MSLMLGLAQTVLSVGSAGVIDEVTVSATKLATPVVEVPATVSVITDERIDRIAADDLKDLLRYEPGVSVRRQIGRFGLADINIRGLDGNRVLLEVDDVRLPDSFAIGSFSSATRDGIDVDLLKRVEIVRGSASSLYGSDALGGVVQFTTRDPLDLLKQGRDFHAGAKLTYGQADDAYGGTATVAGRHEDWSALISCTHRELDEYANGGRIAPDPQNGDNDSFLAKLVWNRGDHQVWRLTGERVSSEVSTDVRSGLGSAPTTPTIQTTALTADDEQLRTRVSLEQELTGLENFFAASGAWRVYWQESATTQDTLEYRSVRSGATPSPRLRDRRFNFDQRLFGAELTFHQPVAAGSTQHVMTYGVEATQTDTEQLRSGGETHLATGVRTTTVGPDAFPVRDFPISATRQLGAYIQDEVRIGAVTFLPGIRVDRYELEGKDDAIFREDNPTITPQGMRATSVNPRFGAVWRVTQRIFGFGSYSRGFRAPPYGDVNVGFTNLQFGYMAIPNPELRPEKSDSYELGVRFVEGDAYFATSVYYNQYDDFIESFVPVGRQNGILLYQSQNLREVRIRGAELQGAWPIGRLAPSLHGLTLRGSLSYGRGEDEDTDTPFNAVDPGRAVLGLEYQAASNRWSAELVATVAQRKTHLDETTGPLFASPGYTAFDLLTHVRFTDSMFANVGVFNLTDKKFWEWSDVRGRAANDPAIERFTQAGRAVAANLKLQW